MGEDNNALVLLIAINALLFVIINFIRIMYSFSYDDNLTAEMFFQKQILDWFQLPVSIDKLSTRPWVIFTYMFTHYKVLHLIGSMLWLCGFGFILQDLAGNNKLIPIYLYGGFVGAVVFLIAANVLPLMSIRFDSVAPFIGGGAAIMAIAVATTTLAPDYRIFPMLNGGIPLWVLTLIFVVFDYVTIARENGGSAVAHLAGGAVGFLFIRQLRRGRDWSLWMIRFVNWIDDLFNPEKKHRGESDKEKLFYKGNKKPYQKTSKVTQQKLDDILDKINQKGYHMLTDEEKDFLKRASDEEL
jgi:membrane associated rhomboid family serine protease